MSHRVKRAFNTVSPYKHVLCSSRLMLSSWRKKEGLKMCTHAHKTTFIFLELLFIYVYGGRGRSLPRRIHHTNIKRAWGFFSFSKLGENWLMLLWGDFCVYRVEEYGIYGSAPHASFSTGCRSSGSPEGAAVSKTTHTCYWDTF